MTTYIGSNTFGTWKSWASRLLRLIQLAILIICLVTSVHVVNAREDDPAQLTDPPFETTLKTTYEVQPDGQSHVVQQFAVRNTSPTHYLNQYTLTINFPELQHIIVKNNGQPLEAEISSLQNATTVKIPFPDQVVGEGKVRNFSVEYDTPDVATVANKVLEVQIPPISSQQKFSNQELILKTPLHFGRAVRVNPQPAAVGIENQFIVTKFVQPASQPISAFFGEQQVFKIVLRYNLENNSSSRGLAQIALPPDTLWQRLYYHSLDPYPNELKIDEDGNWLASYELNPNTAVSVYLTADVLLTLEPNQHAFPTKPSSAHTKSDKYWELNQKNLQFINTDLNTPQEIYDFVVDTLDYSYDLVENGNAQERKGADGALQFPDQAVCQEFTDLFIALTRRAGVPARRLTGYAYTQNPDLRPLSLETDILHSWPEYYDPVTNRWQPVDPTWEDTTGGIDYFHHFDLSHIVFAINGHSSTTPYPAGAYKGSNLETKDVEVSFTDLFPTTEPSYKLHFEPEKLFGIVLPGRYTLNITNQTGQAWYDIDISFNSQIPINYQRNSNQIKLPYLLPYQSLKLPISITTNSWQPNQTTAITYQISTRDQISQSTPADFILPTGPAIVTRLSEEIVYIGVGLTALSGLFIAGSVLVLRQKR